MAPTASALGGATNLHPRVFRLEPSKNVRSRSDCQTHTASLRRPRAIRGSVRVVRTRVRVLSGPHAGHYCPPHEIIRALARFCLRSRTGRVGNAWSPVVGLPFLFRAPGPVSASSVCCVSATWSAMHRWCPASPVGIPSPQRPTAEPAALGGNGKLRLASGCSPCGGFASTTPTRHGASRA